MNVLQEWVSEIPMMQQTVLLTAVRGPDGVTKYHPSKYLLRWYRRCLLLSAMDGRTIEDPYEENGGSFTGPTMKCYVTPDGVGYCYTPLAVDGVKCDTVVQALDITATEYIKSLDAVPHHYQLHFMHAVEILGYKHPRSDIRKWWNTLYERLVNDMHLRSEPENDLDQRLGDSRDQWLSVADPATIE